MYQSRYQLCVPFVRLFGSLNRDRCGFKGVFFFPDTIKVPSVGLDTEAFSLPDEDVIRLLGENRKML